MEFAIDNKFKAELKEKWLTYYQENIAWIVAKGLHDDKYWDHQGNRHTRPKGEFIIPVIAALEPRISTMMPCLCKSKSFEEIVTILGLDFDPDFLIAQEELEKRGIKEIETVDLLSETQA